MYIFCIYIDSYIMNIFVHIKQKLYSLEKAQAFEDILKVYNQNWYAIINYVYFFSIYQKLIKDNDKKYLKALENWDFLLPDGIALRLVMKKQTGQEYHNLNWTDFLPDFLEYLKQKKLDFQIAFWWAKSDVIVRAVDFAKSKQRNVVYFQDGYSQLDREKMLQYFSKNSIKILVQWRSSAKISLQELWWEENKDFLAKNNILLFNQGWTLDFWAWEEKRAPKIFQKANLEWLWRVITKPKKNFQKASETFNMIRFLINVKK